MTVAGGAKVLVPAREKVYLPDGRVVRITKATPFGQPIRSRLTKKIRFQIDKVSDGIIITGSDEYLRILEPAENYAEALPVSDEHRRCLFCNKPVCAFQLQSVGNELNETLHSSGLFAYGSRCEKYGLDYMNIRKFRSVYETGKGNAPKECLVCTSPEISKVEDASELGWVLSPSDVIALQDETDFCDVLSRLPDILPEQFSGGGTQRSLYKCRNCAFILDASTNEIYFAFRAGVTKEEAGLRGSF